MNNHKAVIKVRRLLQKTMAVLLAAVLFVGTAQGGGTGKFFAREADIASGTDWVLDADGKLTIRSDEGMADWASDLNRTCKEQIKIVEIQNGVTSIGYATFAYCFSLASITIPVSVTSIGQSAFGYCRKLTSITIPKNVTKIGLDAFTNCSSLAYVIMESETPPEVKSFVFDDCGFVTDEDDTTGIYVPTGKAQAYKDAWTDWADYIADGPVPAEEHKHDNVTFTPWTETDSLPTDAGNYYLTENVTLSEKWEVPSGKTTLCLNGKTISTLGAREVIIITSSCTLNLYDCTEMGNITGGGNSGVKNQGVFNLYSGKISGNSAMYGGGVINNGTFNMYGGEIRENSASNQGGGVFNNKLLSQPCTFYMCGGEITGNTSQGTGGGVYIRDNAEFKIGGDVVISGNVVINGNENKEHNVYLLSGKTITIDSQNPLSGSAKIGITAKDVPQEGSPINITAVNGADYSRFFTSDNADYEIVNGGNNVVQLALKASSDTQPPTGKIEVEDNSWTRFQSSITFRLFFKEEKNVTITAQDEDSGVDKIYYYISGEELFRQQVEALGADKWTEGSSFSIAPDRKCIIYAKITDKAGNITYLSSAGLVFDATPPVISGVTDGETYHAPQTVTVTDAMFGVKSVTVNGREVTLTGDSFTLGLSDSPQTIVAADQAGNTTTVTVTVQAQTQTYAVTVHNGTGGGNYRAGATVTITANAPAGGKQFDRWLVGRGGVTLADSTSSTTTFTMPDQQVDVSATYKDITEEHTHNYGDWQHDDTQHWKVCACGDETDRANHDFGDWITDKAATATEMGTKHRECQTCGYRQTETIPVTGTDPGSGTVTPEVKPGVNAPATNISTPAEELKDMLLTEEEKQQLQNGTDIRIVLEVQDAGNTVSVSDQAAVAQALNGFTVGQYLNVDLYKLIGENRADITETAEKIRIVMAVPDSLKNINGNTARTFAVIRIHDGRAELLNDLDSSADTITIETDRFSTYAVVYQDKSNGGNGNTKPDRVKDNEPKTGDDAPLELYATLAMIAGFSYLLLYFTDRKRGITEETKRELVARLIAWAKRGGKLRKLPAFAAIFAVLVYYHSIGKNSICNGKEFSETEG